MEGMKAFEGKDENWEVFKDAFAPQPSRKPLRAWERAAVPAHAPRLQGQKIWKKRGGLRARQEGQENHSDAFLELEKEGAGARKKARAAGIGAKQNISIAKWKDAKDESGWDEKMAADVGSPRKVGSPDKSLVVPRKRTNANMVITPRKPLRQMMLDGQGQNTNASVPVVSPKGKETKASPVRRRKSMRKSGRQSLAGESMQGSLVQEENRRSSSEFNFTVHEQSHESPRNSASGRSETTSRRQSIRQYLRGQHSELETLPQEDSLSHLDTLQPSGDAEARLPATAHESQKEGASLTLADGEPIMSAKLHYSGLVTDKDKAFEEKTTSTASPFEPVQVSTNPSLRRSTRRSDRLRVSSDQTENLSENASSITELESTSTCATTTDSKVQSIKREPAMVDGQDSDSLTFSIDLNLREDGSKQTVQDADAEVSNPIEEVGQIVEDLLAQPLSGMQDSEVTGQRPLRTSYDDAVFLEGPLSEHSSDIGDFDDDDDDMNESMSDLSDILLEPTINVDALGLQRLDSDDDIEDTQAATEADSIEDRESHEAAIAADLDVSLPSNIVKSEDAMESSASITTSTEKESLEEPSKAYASDDTDLLREFLTKVKADKAARQAAPKRKKSLPHSPIRLPLGDPVEVEASSPVQEPTKDDLDTSIPHLTLSPPSKRRKIAEPSTSTSTPKPEPQSIRRSGRTRLPVLKAPLPAPSHIPVRRLAGQDPDSTVRLRGSMEKALAALTKLNTEKNEGELKAADFLVRKAVQKEDPVMRQRYLREVFDEKVRKEKKLREGEKGRRRVTWKEEIAQYRILEADKPVRVPGAGAGTRKVKVKGGEKEKVGDGEEIKVEEKVTKERKVRVGVNSRSTSKIALSTNGNGTPAKRKRVGRA